MARVAQRLARVRPEDRRLWRGSLSLVRWKTLWLWALSLVGTPGCPHAFERGGTIDRAMHKDLMEQLKNGDCTDIDIRRYCGVGMSLEECLDQCG